MNTPGKVVWALLHLIVGRAVFILWRPWPHKPVGWGPAPGVREAGSCVWLTCSALGGSRYGKSR
jgi:hypothetical protein